MVPSPAGERNDQQAGDCGGEQLGALVDHGDVDVNCCAVAGVLTMEVDGTRHRLTARSGIEIAPGVAHQAMNEGDTDAEFLVVSTPPSHGDRIAADS